jgi:hypothetical protein
LDQATRRPMAPKPGELEAHVTDQPPTPDRRLPGRCQAPWRSQWRRGLALFISCALAAYRDRCRQVPSSTCSAVFADQAPGYTARQARGERHILREFNRIPYQAAEVSADRQSAVHNYVRPTSRLNSRGFRAWLDDPDEKYEECTCGWAPHLVHHRVRPTRRKPAE